MRPSALRFAANPRPVGVACLLSLVLGAVVLAQTLGLMHGLVHAVHNQLVAPAELQHHHDEAADDHGAWLEALFASHDEGGGSCRVVDQQGHSALIPAIPSLALPSVLRAAVPPARIGCDLSGAALPFEARAPPASR